MDTKCIGVRVGAFVIDLILAWIVVIAVGSFLLETVEVPAGGLGVDACELINDEYPICFNVNDDYYVGTDGDVVALLLVGAATWIAIRIIPQGLNGRTPGKKLLGLKVVNAEGVPPGIGRSALREIMWLIDSLPFLYLIGFITAAATKKNTRVGDMVAGTFVARADSVASGAIGSPESMGYQSAPPPVPTNQPVWDVERGAYVHRDPTGRVQVYDNATGQWRDG